LPAVTGQGNVDRLSIIASGYNVEQLLGVPVLNSGKGECQAAAVIKCINEWKIKHTVIGMCFDSTASNTGRLARAAHLIEKRLSKELLCLPCRHHVLEIVAGKAFMAVQIEVSSGPDIAIFKRFRDQWYGFDSTKFETAGGVRATAAFKDRVIDFAVAVKTLAISQPRDLARVFRTGNNISGRVSSKRNQI
jgi:hypothetical protein